MNSRRMTRQVRHKGLTNGAQYQYTHVQVPFVTRGGKQTTCDEGMFDILELLKQMGVNTQYSCQGDEFGGYICAFTPGVRRVINAAMRLHNDKWLSDQSMRLMDDWCLDGERHFRIASNRVARLRYDGDPKQYFSYERDPNSLYGDRTTIRWPKDRGDEFHQLLLEIQPHI